MSSKNEDLPDLQDDEVYIAKLYKKLADEPLTDVEHSQQEQDLPSSALDQLILSAAHKAVKSKPQSIKSKRPLYYTFIASAASLVLVFSLVIKQEEQLMVPATINEISNGGGVASNQREALSDSSLAEGNDLLEEEKLQITPRKPALSVAKVQSAQKKQALEEMKASEQVMRKKTQQARSSEKYKKTKLRAKKELAQTTSVISAEPEIEQIVVTGSRFSSLESDRDSDLVDETQPSVTHSKLIQDYYHEFLALQTKWLLIQIDEEKYIIEIATGDQQGTRFYLFKTDFEIPRIKTMQSNEKTVLHHWQEIIINEKTK